MANNPYVDGLTNLAIPDCSNGADLSYHEVRGNLYAIESGINGDLRLTETRVGHEMIIKELENCEYLGASRSRFERLELGESEISSLWLHESEGKYVHLNSLSIDECLNANELVARDLSAERLVVRGDYASFSGIRLERDCYLKSLSCEHLDLIGAEIGNDLIIDGCKSVDGSPLRLSLSNAQVKGSIRFIDTCLSSNSDFTGLTVDRSYVGDSSKIPPGLHRYLQ